MTHDPEPDRDQAAARPSDGFERMRVVAPLLDSLDQALDALGCRNGLHDWDHEFIGDPPDVPNRRLAWSRVDVKCGDCGQKARLVFGEKPAVPPEQDVRRLLITAEIAEALKAGFEGSTELVQIRPLQASLLWMALRRALDLIRGDETIAAAASLPDPLLDRLAALRCENTLLRHEAVEARAERDSYLAQIAGMPAVTLLAGIHARLDDLMAAVESVGAEGHGALAERMHGDLSGLRRALEGDPR